MTHTPPRRSTSHAAPTGRSRTARRGRAALAACAVLSLALSACGGTSAGEDAAASSTVPSDPGAFPVTVQHAYGETVLEEAPARVATVAWGDHEVPLALGVVPVGMSEATWGDDDGDGVLPWVEKRLEELDAETPTLFDESDGIDFEAVAATDPDVILAAYSGLTREEYDTLSKIAPTVAYPETAWSTSLEDMVRLDSQALGLQDEGEQLVADLDQDVEEQVAARPALAGASVLVAYVDPTDLSQLGFYTTHDTRPAFLAEVGTEVPAVVEEASQQGDGFYTTISSERADELDDVDVLVTYGDTDGSTMEALQDDPLLGRIPAVRDGAVVVLEDSTPLAAAANPSPLSVDAMLGDYLDLLEAALTDGAQGSAGGGA